MNRRRLEAEAIRDSVLTAAGTLNRQVGGPSVKVPLEPEVYDLIFTEGEPDGLWPVTPDAKQHTRRSIYLFNKRNVRLPMLEAFDQPDTLNSCAVPAGEHVRPAGADPDERPVRSRAGEGAGGRPLEDRRRGYRSTAFAAGIGPLLR